MKKILTILSLFAGISAMAQTVVYQKVQSEPTDWSGEYLIVREYDDDNDIAYVFDGSLDKDGIEAKLNFFEADMPHDNNDTRYILSNAQTDAAAFTIAKDAENEGEYTICSKSGFYIGYNSLEIDPESGVIKADIKASNEKTYPNKIKTEINSKGKLNINIQSANGYLLQFKDSKKDPTSNRFRYYSEGAEKAIKLYKKVTVDNSTLTSVKVITLNEAADAVLYDLMGRRVTEPKRGIYVMNGAKVVVK
ncbi:MAG: hypothetical protein MJZ01_06075 [Bacteroidales bacterium]|nr:hypothetical protein [Bacteroidales bacterium]